MEITWTCVKFRRVNSVCSYVQHVHIMLARHPTAGARFWKPRSQRERIGNIFKVWDRRAKETWRNKNQTHYFWMLVCQFSTEQLKTGCSSSVNSISEIMSEHRDTYWGTGEIGIAFFLKLWIKWPHRLWTFSDQTPEDRRELMLSKCTERTFMILIDIKNKYTVYHPSGNKWYNLFVFQSTITLEIM